MAAKARSLLFSIKSSDCEWQTFRAGGKGGQHQNKTETGVRVVHRPSGAVGESRETRSQLTNKRAAFRRMGESKRFLAWARLQAAKLAGMPSVDERVERDLQPEYLRIEVKDAEGRWTLMAGTEEER